MVFKRSRLRSCCNIVVVRTCRRVKIFVLIAVKHVNCVRLALCCFRYVCGQPLLELNRVVISRVDDTEVVLRYRKDIGFDEVVACEVTNIVVIVDIVCDESQKVSHRLRNK